MSLLYFYSMFCLLMVCIFFLLMMVTYKPVVSAEKNTTFECGFDSFLSPRIPFCMKFFLLAILFLVFDVEVALLLPIMWSSYMITSFLLILLGGLGYEWVFGSLNWVT